LKTKVNLIFIFCLLGSIASFAQQNDDDLVQLSGFAVSYDSTKVLPYVSIRINGGNKGTYSDMGGYFSLVVKKTDRVLFTAIGLRPVEYNIPKDFEGNKLNTVIPMSDDTFYLPETVIRSYPSKEQFDYYFVKTKIPDDELSLAYRNLRKKPLEDQMASLAPDGQETNRWYMQQQYDKYYYSGQAQPLKIFDVGAWSQFLNSINTKKKKK
jgi:hypothetical protein